MVITKTNLNVHIITIYLIEKKYWSDSYSEHSYIDRLFYPEIETLLFESLSVESTNLFIIFNKWYISNTFR